MQYCPFNKSSRLSVYVVVLGQMCKTTVVTLPYIMPLSTDTSKPYCMDDFVPHNVVTYTTLPTELLAFY